MNNQKTDKRLIEEFIQELDRRGYNFFILKGIRSLLRQEKKEMAHCPKCGEEVKSDEDSMCGYCAR